MLAKVSSAALVGLDAHLVDVEVDISGGLPQFSVVGLPDATVRESRDRVRARVLAACARQRVRYQTDGIYTNAQLKPRLVKRYCGLAAAPQELLEQAMARLNLSARAHGRILRVARTIADLAGAEKIEIAHVAEAIQYRALDRTIEG